MSLEYWFTLEAYGLSDRYVAAIIKDTWKTLEMVGWSTFLGTLFGAPIGIYLATSQKNDLFALPWANRIFGFICNVFRSIPFIILTFAILPFTRFLVGNPFSVNGASVALAICATPFIARLVEGCIREVDQGLTEAARAYGATPLQIVFKVLIPEALPGIINVITLATISIIGYSAMVGAIGAGGLGNLALSHGFQQYKAGVMWTIVIIFIIIVQIVQWIGDWLSRRVNKRIRQQ